VVGDGDPLGWVGGALLGVLWGNQMRLRREVETLRAGLLPGAGLAASSRPAVPVRPADAETTSHVAAPRPAAPDAAAGQVPGAAADPWTARPSTAVPAPAGQGDRRDAPAPSAAPATPPAAAAGPGLLERLFAIAW